MCEVLPTIVDEEDEEGSKLEQLMISMLEERDKLMENLRESQESYKEATKQLADIEADNKILMRQLQALMPEEEDRLKGLIDDIRSGRIAMSSEDVRRWPVAQKFANMARELASVSERVVEKEEQIEELKSERANTRLLLEHLECLVARHEKSLRMTVVKRQTSSAGVSSETEVLKALKSLFDHHKALDEKVRERLRTAQERIAVLEDELLLGNQELKTLQEENKRMRGYLTQRRQSVRMSTVYDNVSMTKEQLALVQERDQAIDDLQFSLDEKDSQLEEMMHLRDELAEKVTELDEELTFALTEIKRLKTANKKMVAESSHSPKVDPLMESQLADSRQELALLRDKVQHLQDQLSAKEVASIKAQEGYAHVQAELKARELLVSDLQAKNRVILASQTEKLTRAEQREGTAQSTIDQLKGEVDRKQQELNAAVEKERINESNISQLQSAVDRMLKESRERLITYSNERKQLVEEKTQFKDRSETLEQELSLSRQANGKLKEEMEGLRAQLNKLKESNGISTKVELRPRKPGSPNLRTSPNLRSSLHVTDLDAAIESHARESPLLTSTQHSKEPGLDDEAAEDWDVTNLVSMLENQVSRLDQQIESMGGDISEASEFDRVMQSMSDGTYQSSKSSAMETFPHSSVPVPRNPKKNKFRPDVLPGSTLYRVNTPTAPSPDQVSPPSSASSNESQGSAGGKKLGLRHRSSFRKLFRTSRKSQKKNQARRASAPVAQAAARFGDNVLIRESVDFSDLLESSDEREEDRKRKSELLNAVLEKGTPFSRWDSHTLLAWLEVWVGVPFWYIAAIRGCLQSGKTLANISDSELEQELGITNSLHRLKLRLAVQEIVSITSTDKLQRTTSLFGEMAHEWVGDYWLPSLGLPQYKELFKMCLVDARMLEHLTKKDLRTALKMVDASHRNSLQYGISVLKKLDYSRKELEERRSKVDVREMTDVMVWSNDHVTQWVQSIGLSEYAPNLLESGVHGGTFALDNDFDHQKFALALKIPLTNPEVRQKLKVEFGKLLVEGTKRVSSESQSHGKIVRKLSKKLKVGTRKVVPPSDFASVRPRSPVLYAAKPAPIYLHSLVEQSDSGSSQNTTTNSVDTADLPGTPVELKAQQ